MSGGQSAPSTSQASAPEDLLSPGCRQPGDRTHARLVLEDGVCHLWIEVLDDQLLQMVFDQGLYVNDRHACEEVSREATAGTAASPDEHSISANRFAVCATAW